MILSQCCNPIGKGRGSGRNGNKPGKEVFQLESSIEPKAEFRQIAGKMLFPDCMVRPMDRILHVSQDRVHPPEVQVLTAFGSAAFVPGSRSRDPCEGRKGPRPNGKNRTRAGRCGRSRAGLCKR